MTASSGRLGTIGEGGGDGAVTAKTSVRRRNAFLRAFAETGNQTLAAAQAGVSRSTIYKMRRADAGFDSDWRAAKAESAARLRAGESNRPPRGWALREGAALIVQRSAKRAPKVVRSLRVRWTPRAEDRFLGQLRQCNNARLACSLAGMTLSSYEAHWRRWPDFRRRVSEARAFAALSLDSKRAEWAFEIDWELVESLPPTIAEALRLAIRHRRGR